MKHIRILCLLLIVSMISLTGCMDVKDISEEKADLVAEYAAGVLLRYSDQYEYRLITKEQQMRQEEQGTEEPSVTPAATDAAEPVATDAGGEAGEQPAETQVPEVSPDELYQLDGIQVSYDSSEFTKQYKNTEVRAGQGETLFVVSFALKNTSGAAKKVNLMDRKIQYTLDVDGNQYYPGINMLPDGTLDYLETTIGKGKTEKAVLIFTMDQERTSASNVNLTIEEGSKKTSIKIK